PPPADRRPRPPPAAPRPRPRVRPRPRPAPRCRRPRLSPDSTCSTRRMLLSKPRCALRRLGWHPMRAPAVAVALLLLLAGTAVARTIEGTDRSDRLVGTARADVLLGRGGADRLTGLAGGGLPRGGAAARDNETR